MTDGELAQPDRGDGPESVLARLRDEVAGALGPDLIALCVYGSWVEGDFAPGRSDLDLLAVVSNDPDPSTLPRLQVVHDQLAAEFPAWAGRIETEYVSVEALTRYRTDPQQMIKISPGEPLHLVTATSHHLLNWYSAGEHGRRLLGPEPREIMPPIAASAARAVVLQHLRNWSEWVQEMDSPGRQAYAVLTVSRALGVLLDGGRRSKRQAGVYAARQFPEWAELIAWAVRWWYLGGSDEQASRQPEVVAFVQHAVVAIKTA